jgi:hypothetical protein
MTLDGVLNEPVYGETSFTSITDTDCNYGTGCGATDTTASAQFKTVVNSTGLWIGVVVNDPGTLYADTAAPWNGSAVEIFLDVNNTKGGYNTTSGDYNDANTYQFAITYNANAVVEYHNATARTILAKSVTTASGYTMEVEIPWANLGVAEPSAGSLSGLDVAVDVANAAGTARDHEIAAYNAGFNPFDQTPAEWGEILYQACNSYTLTNTPVYSATATPTITPVVTSTRTPTPSPTNSAPTPTYTYTAVTYGATLPYTEYEAEDGVYTGSTLLGPSRSVLTTDTNTEAAAEASGREAVQLNATGQYVEWTTSAQCNSIVVRLSVPDAAAGNGANYTIGVFIDNATTPQLELPVTSKYSWVYGNTWPSGTICGYNKTPSAGYPHHIYDEAHALLGVEVPAGHIIKLMRTSADTASSYDIDFVDLEDVGAQIAQPANSISAMSSPYNATGNGTTDDTTAVQNCINAAASAGKIAYLPAGTYKISNYLTVGPVTVQGAGMWYTTIHQTSDTSVIRFNLNGTSAEVSDVLLQGEVVNRCDTSEDSALDAGGGSNSLIQRVWTEHTKCGWWAPGESGLTVTGCRFRDTYADGINLNSTATNCTVTQCNVRNTGDDSLASWANGGTDNSGITFTYNTVQCPWRANGVGIYGGTGYTISHNYIADTLDYTGIMIGNEFSCDAFGGTNTVQYNSLERCGGYFGADFGAFNVWAEQGAVGGTWNISNLVIDSPTYMGIQFEGGDGISGFSFSSSQVTNAATYGLQVMSGTGGSAAFTTTTITGSGSGSFTNGGSMSITDGAGDNW